MKKIIIITMIGLIILSGINATGQEKIPIPIYPPEAKIEGPHTAYIHETILLNASKSTDKNNDIVEYLWDLNTEKDTDGDGITDNDIDATGIETTCNYEYTDIYKIKLTVIDSKDLKDEDTLDIAVNFEDKYAVIMVGRYFGRFKDLYQVLHPKEILDDIQWYYNVELTYAGLMYETLINKYHYKAENIYVLAKLLTNDLTWDDQTYFKIPDSFNPDWIYNEDPYNLNVSLETTLQNILNSLKGKLDEKDSFLLFFQDHGITSDQDGDNDGILEITDPTFFGCPFRNFGDWFKSMFPKIFGNNTERLWDWELAQYVDGIDDDGATMIFLLQPCHSGGFIKELSKPGKKRIICTASDFDTTADGPWTAEIINTLAGNRDADYNNDKHFSILEVHKRATFRVAEWYENPDHIDEHFPLIDDNGDGNGLYKNDVNYKPEPNQDGYLASKTVLNINNPTPQQQTRTVSPLEFIKNYLQKIKPEILSLPIIRILLQLLNIQQ